MTVLRLALATLWLLPALALGQAKENDEDKVSNDQPGRPLQMAPASTEVKEAFDDFERFRRRGSWERAFKALYTIPDAQAHRFVDGENGFIVSVARKRRALLSALPPEGQAAYRLFYDAEAQKLLEEADGPSELKNLERIYSAYFASSVGDNAADRLGDLDFELGHFDHAADCWLAILRERPDTDLPLGLVAVKAALALSRSGRRSELAQVCAELADRYADEKVTLGGQTGSPAALLLRLLGDEASTADVATGKPSALAGGGPDLAGPLDAVWQMRFAESVEAGMTPAELNQWESNPLSGVVPAVAAEGTTLFANYLGHVFALDLKTGKMLWRSAPFHHLELSAMQDQARAIDPSRFAIVASGEHVWTLGRDLKEQNYFAFRLTCRRADGGEVVWQSSDLSDYAQIDLVGPPLLAGGKLFIAAKTLDNQQQQSQQFVLAVRPLDGKVLWKTEVGTFRQGNQFYFNMYNRVASPQPRLLYHAGAIYADTQVGVLARLDADSGALDWGFGYRTDAVQGQNRFFFFGGYNQPSEPATAGSPILQTGEAFLVKGVNSDRLYAVEPNRMKVLWERPIAKASRLLAVDDRALYLGGPELNALDLENRKLLWSTRPPSGSTEAHVLSRPDGLWQLTPRGVFEIDPKSGTVRRIFRGEDLGAVGGNLFLTEGLLLAVSNRTISVYPRRATGAGASAREGSTATKTKGLE